MWVIQLCSCFFFPSFFAVLLLQSLDLAIGSYTISLAGLKVQLQLLKLLQQSSFQSPLGQSHYSLVILLGRDFALLLGTFGLNSICVYPGLELQHSHKMLMFLQQRLLALSIRTTGASLQIVLLICKTT